MASIKEILDSIANESGTKGKISILASHKDNDLLKRVIYLASSGRVKFHIKQIPDYKPSYGGSLEEALDELSKLSSKELTGHAGINHLKMILSSLSPDDAYIIERIIGKDLKIGMLGKNINKAIKNLIEVTPYMGAQSYSEKGALKLFNGQPIKSDVKEDGRYGNSIIHGGSIDGVGMVSRQGETTYLYGSKLFKELEQFEDIVLNGELLVRGVERYKANGIITSLIDINEKEYNGIDITKELKKFEKNNGMTYYEALDKVEYACWDCIPLNDYFDKKNNEPYSERWERLKGIVNNTETVRLVEHRMITTFEEAIQHFLEILARGGEGTIIKTMDGVWKSTKPSYQIKMKVEMTVDLRIIGFNWGSKGSKNENVISSLVTESDCGVLTTDPGGMSEELMQEVTDNMDSLLGTIVEVKSCGVSQNSKGEYSLLHPSVVRLRDDKDSCDDLESIA